MREYARPIIILAPMSPVAIVYDLEDTDGKKIPKYFDEAYKVSGEMAEAKWDNTLKYCIEVDNFKIIYNEKSFLNCACVSRRWGDQYIIEINKSFEDVRLKYSLLAHEIAHVYCGHLGADEKDPKKRRWDNSAHLTRDQREVEAETVAYLVCSRCGIETKAIEYVAGYLKNPEEDLSRISVKVILDVARDIENISKDRPKETGRLLNN